ncbi:MAG: hypothetical protein KFF49_07585 [Bacteroidales bacterium]|nr:hypothetical protein [Bacteroidales bacterium]
MPRIFIILLLMVAGIIRPHFIQGQDSDVLIKRIIINYDSVLYDMYRDVEASGLYILHNSDNDLLIVCNELSLSTRFSFFLDGNDERWSAWFDRPLKEYTNLKPGRYTLYIRTMEDGVIGAGQRITGFRIKPPFYLTPVSIAIYVFLLFMFIYFVFRLLIYRQKLKQVRLEAIISERTEELMSEKEKTENLLANLLPKDTADEIMLKGKATKQKYNFVTVLFSDIEGFTRIAEEVNPEILIDELDNFFFHFDSVAGKYNIEKIKTIGDAYMCAGGIPHRNRTNPLEVVLAALEMQEFMFGLKEEQTARGIKFWDIRIGIHTGTVIAGVVGQKKLSYDIWGDTVNTASRMESSGMPGKINISGVTYEYVKDFFICEYRGKMPVKYKGDLDMYFVNGIRPELRGTGKAEPNKLFINKLLMLKIQDLEDYYFDWYAENVPADFVFHNLKFIKNICTQTELLATAGKLGDEEILGLRLAALFVKSGMLEDYSEPLEHSLAKMKEMAPGFGFSDAYMEQAETIIRASYAMETGSKQVKILLDAMNDYCGHIDYPEMVGLRFKEEEAIRGVKDKDSWYAAEIERISKHEFYTGTARMLRSYSGPEQADKLRRYHKHI